MTLLLQTLATLDLAAASGIALRNDELYVIADDRLELAIYSLTGERVGEVPLLAGALPADNRERKREKPDFEALVCLPDGSLLAIGSGSTERRTRGALVQFDRDESQVQLVDLSALYASLAVNLPELNIEGAAVLDDSLYLASRGNGPSHDNALIRIDLARIFGALRAKRAVPADSVLGVQRVSLGELEGVPLGLTDLTVVDRELLFSAAAEAGDSTYEDGTCAGSVLGILSLEGQVRAFSAVSPAVKIEGVCAQGHKLWLVADADDPLARAPLMAASWSGL